MFLESPQEKNTCQLLLHRKVEKLRTYAKEEKTHFLHKTQSVPKPRGFGTDSTIEKTTIYPNSYWNLHSQADRKC